MKTKISLYKSSKDTSGVDIDFTEFIRGIKEGKWQDEVLRVRIEKDPEKQSSLKKMCHGVTISGSFEKRKDGDLRKHSGFITMDIDHVDDPRKIKKQIDGDPYIYCAFDSIRGKGLCILFKIDPDRHLDAFSAIAKYLYDTYQLIVDQSCKNVSRLRFVSFDPYIYINEDAVVFKKYLPKPKKQKVNKVVYVETDLDRIITEIYNRGINLCEDYADWISICYALTSQFGDSKTGRDYFDTLSSLSSKYNSQDCEKQYDACLKNMSPSKTKQSTINTIYHYAKVNGIEIYSQQTKDIIRAASSQHKNGVSKESIAKGLEKFNAIPSEQSNPVIEQVISNGIDHVSESIIDDIQYFLQPYGLKKNLITRNVEMNGKPLDDSDINTLFIDCKSVFDKTSKDLICSVIYSNKIEQYHPIKDFLNKYEGEEIKDYPNLHKIINSIESDTPHYDVWITKWLVSLIASVDGTYSPLLLVLCGERQGTGKTEWFRRLLPKSIRSLFGESKMDGGKDDEILMTKKWIIFDDEFGGKSKREEKRLKEITSKEFINVREPYGRVSVDLRRISVFCGSSNDNQILSDPTGNRRILPVHVLSINHEMYNSADKDQLFHEINSIYRSGYDWRVLQEEIEILKESTKSFNASTPEEELISTKLEPVQDEMLGEWMTITQIIQYLIADTKINTMSNVRVGMILTASGFKKKQKKFNGIPLNVYLLKKNIT